MLVHAMWCVHICVSQTGHKHDVRGLHGAQEETVMTHAMRVFAPVNDCMGMLAASSCCSSCSSLPPPARQHEPPFLPARGPPSFQCVHANNIAAQTHTHPVPPSLNPPRMVAHTTHI